MKSSERSPRAWAQAVEGEALLVAKEAMAVAIQVVAEVGQAATQQRMRRCSGTFQAYEGVAMRQLINFMYHLQAHQTSTSTNKVDVTGMCVR